MSRYGLVLLASKHFQQIVRNDRKEVDVSTDIGRFTICYYEGRNLVHFDGTDRLTLIPW